MLVSVDIIATYYILCILNFINNLHFLLHDPIPSTDTVDNLIWKGHVAIMAGLGFYYESFHVYLAEDQIYQKFTMQINYCIDP